MIFFANTSFKHFKIFYIKHYCRCPYVDAQETINLRYREAKRMFSTSSFRKINSYLRACNINIHVHLRRLLKIALG
jgi:hypothetical protein